MQKYPLLFGNYQGELLQVTEGSGKDGSSIVKYDVLVTLTNGSQTVLGGVTMASMFGGIGDTFQARLLTTHDIQDFDYINDSRDDDAHRSTTGCRVIIVFLAGHIQFPVITGFLNHPKGTRYFDNHSDLDPQFNLTFNGMSWLVNGDGEFEIIHRGPPTVSYEKGDGGLAAGASGLASAASLTGGVDPTAIPDNPALELDSEDVTLRVKWLKGGGFRINDAVGQMIEMDHTQNRIYISNNDITSIDGDPEDSMGPSIATNDTDAEYMLWDFDKQLILINARKTLQLYSFDKRKDVTEGDHTHHVKSDEMITVDGDKTDKYGGSWTFTVDSDYSATISGDNKWDITGDWTATTDGDTNIAATGKVSISSSADLSITASDGKFTAEGSEASLTLTNGTIALKGSQGEVMALIGQILNAILSLTVPTSPGGGPSGPPINSSDFAQLMSKFQGMAG